MGAGDASPRASCVCQADHGRQYIARNLTFRNSIVDQLATGIRPARGVVHPVAEIPPRRTESMNSAHHMLILRTSG